MQSFMNIRFGFYLKNISQDVDQQSITSAKYTIFLLFWLKETSFLQKNTKTIFSSLGEKILITVYLTWPVRRFIYWFRFLTYGKCFSTFAPENEPLITSFHIRWWMIHDEAITRGSLILHYFVAELMFAIYFWALLNRTLVEIIYK